MRRPLLPALGPRGAMLAACAVLCGASCSGAPPLRITHADNAVTVDVQTLGEYQTTVGRIRLTDQADGRIVWEVVAAASPPPQIHTFKLSPGPNPTVVSEDYRVVTPAAGRSFLLQGGRQYRIELWGDHVDRRPASAVFQLP